MRLIVFGLTFLAAGLFFQNFISKKGTKWHIVRGALVFLLPLLVIAINTVTVSSTRGLKWDFAFQAHFWLGILFFAALTQTVFFGYRMKRAVLGSSEYDRRRNLHRTFASAAAVFFLASLVFAAALRFVR